MGLRASPSLRSTRKSVGAGTGGRLRTGADGGLGVLNPLLVLGRGAHRLAGRARDWWERTPHGQRGPTLFGAGVCAVLLWLLPYGPPLELFGLLAATVWCGWRGTPVHGSRVAPTEAESLRLQALYEALVPYFTPEGDPHPEPLYAYDGEWEDAFEEFAFRDGRISRLLLRYPVSFRDGELAERVRIEELLAAKTGRGREHRFCWDEECNLLEVTVPPPLPTGIHAQPFVTAPGETVLGFTDGLEVGRTVPVRVQGERAPQDVPPVMWRTGHRSTEQHMLAVGTPGSGTSSLLRSIALQAARRGEVLIVDGDSGGEFACFAARHGVLGVESTLPGAVAALEWAARETERRLAETVRSRQRGGDVPECVRRPLWLLVDRPTALSCLARSRGEADPQELLRIPLRHGRAAGVTVAVAEQFDAMRELAEPVLGCTRARVVLGAVSPGQAGAVLGRAPQSGPAPDVPPGRGFARIGHGPVLRLQVPATPDPSDETAGKAERNAVRRMLPGSVRAPVAAPVREPTAREAAEHEAAVGADRP